MIKLKSLILESKQSIINLGYPEIIASLFYEKFGNIAYIIANWYKQYHASQLGKDWFLQAHHRSSGNFGLFDMVGMYYSTDTVEHYSKESERLGLSNDDYVESEMDVNYLKKQRELWKNEIKENLFKSSFFTANTIIIDIESGKLKNLAPYKDLKFWEAALKYDERRVFSEMTPLRVYSNGYKWINVGKRCHLLGHYMANCGSAGLMSWDADRTLLGLFDVNNKPHVVVTYSPNEKRISGDEGPGYSEVKSIYHEYVLDLANYLGVSFDANKSKSKFLQLKYRLKDKASNIKRLDKYCDTFNEYFSFNIGNKVYYTNGDSIISADDMKTLRDAIKDKKIKLKQYPRNIIRAAFNRYNVPDIQQLGIKYYNVYNLNDL